MQTELAQCWRVSVANVKGTRGSRVKGARVDKKPTLATQGIDKNLADRARKVAAKVVVAARFLVGR